jgi:hypothetical protein
MLSNFYSCSDELISSSCYTSAARTLCDGGAPPVDIYRKARCLLILYTNKNNSSRDDVSTWRVAPGIRTLAVRQLIRVSSKHLNICTSYFNVRLSARASLRVSPEYRTMAERHRSILLERKCRFLSYLTRR